MQQVDYIVVGGGIAATCFIGQLIKNQKSFVLFDDQSASATAIAGGTLNPVVLKRFTSVWRSAQFLDSAHTFYSYFEEVLDTTFLNELEIARVFHNIQEQNDWLVASDRNELKGVLHPSIEKQINENIKAPYGLGKVHGGFQLHPKVFLRRIKEHLTSEQYLIEPFNHNTLEITKEGMIYQNLIASNIVFAEGAKLQHNPLLDPTYLILKKGEYITVKIPNLNLKTALKAGYFIIPLGNDCYKIGATFAHGDFTNEITKAGREKLLVALKKVTDLPFELIEQEQGMRPTVRDRRPLLGKIPNHQHCYILNGLGTRGLLMAPLLSEWLYDSIEKGSELPSEVNINRFY